MSLGPLFFSAGIFWLAVPVTALLLLSRLYRTRRREVMAGSLLLWRRLAAEQPKIPPRRWPFDLSFLLQLAALLTLIAALSEPTWAVGNERARELLLVIDNGPVSRARGDDGTPLLRHVIDAAASRLHELKGDDRVFIAYSSPSMKVITGALSPAEALNQLKLITPALSGPDTDTVWSNCAETARRLDRSGNIRRLVFSLRAAPRDLESQWRCATPPGVHLGNVGVVGFGSAFIPDPRGERTEVLLRLHNFSNTAATGSIHYELIGEAATSDDAARTKFLSVEPTSDGVIVFSLPGQPKSPIHFTWRDQSKHGDALPEDDSIVAVPRTQAAPRIRFYPTVVPALARLFSSITPPAILIQASDPSPVDLEIRVQNVPETTPSNARALMLLSPDSEFQSLFHLTGGVLKQPDPQMAVEDPLTRFIKPSPDGLFVVGAARELQVTGAMTVLIKDRATDHPLIATMKDDKGRPVFLFAFVPGQGQPVERPLEPELAALIIEMADRAAGLGEPLTVATARELERTLGAPLPLQLNTTSPQEFPQGFGVLDESASRLELGEALPSRQNSADDKSWNSAARADAYSLRPLLILLALCLAALEFWLERPKSLRTAGRTG